MHYEQPLEVGNSGTGLALVCSFLALRLVSRGALLAFFFPAPILRPLGAGGSSGERNAGRGNVNAQGAKVAGTLQPS